MPKVVQGYPFTIFIDAFRSNLMAVLGIFLALYISTALTSFLAWQPPEPIYFLTSPIWNPFFWAARLKTSGWIWIAMLILGGSFAAYIFFRALRFDLILLIALTCIYLNVFLYRPEDLPGQFLNHWLIPEWRIPVHFRNLPTPFVVRLAIASLAIAAIWIASFMARPWKDRDWGS